MSPSFDPSDDPPLAYEPPDPERPASSAPPASSDKHDPYAALQFRDYRFFALGSAASVVGQQMLSVAVGLELYERTHSATALGLVGLVQALPILVLALPAGHAADVLDRRRIVLTTQLMFVLASLGLAVTSWSHQAIPRFATLVHANRALAGIAHAFGESGARFDDPAIPVVFSLLFLLGIARAYNDPARSSLLPRIVPRWAFPNAVTWSSSGFQIASVIGPALGGLMLAQLSTKPYRFAAVYMGDALCALAMFGLFFAIESGRKDTREKRETPTETSLAAGMKFVWSTKIILATITLDLFAVLLGGAVALLPIFATDILHTDAAGLGWLRASPSIGAFLMALLLAHLPPMKHAGMTLLWAVIGFGVATIVFGLSHSFWLSFAMLFFTGAFDNVSVVVRHTLVQVLTPDSLRGRVSAVNNVFIGSSNELGALESGLTAAAFGPVVSVVGGGIGTIVVVLAVAAIWPQVRRFGRLDSHHALE